MGNELMCRVRFGKEDSEGKALLETGEIIFRGEFRLKIPFSTVRAAEVDDGALVLRTEAGVAIFELGQGAAEKWREKILHPKSRIEKLGVQADATVALIGFSAEEDVEFLGELGERTKNLSHAVAGKFKEDVQWIFLKVDTQRGLGLIAKIAKSMRGAAALWIVFPKGNPKGGQNITEGDVLAAGRAARLKDIKVVGFSERHTALKFVIPLALRHPLV
jgi:hypothetical protein